MVTPHILSILVILLYSTASLMLNPVRRKFRKNLSSRKQVTLELYESLVQLEEPVYTTRWVSSRSGAGGAWVMCRRGTARELAGATIVPVSTNPDCNRD